MTALNIQAKGNDPTEIRKIFQQLRIKVNSDFVPYSGAIKSVDLGSYNLTANTLVSTVAIGVSPLSITSTTLVSNLNSDLLDGKHASAFLYLDQTTPQAVINGSPIMEGIQFDTTPSTSNVAEGLLRWNSTDGTLDLGMSGGDVTMQIGQEMFMKVRNVSGSLIANGIPVYVSGRTGNRPNIYPARSDSDSTSCVCGITTQDISSPADGFITTFGYVRGIKTNYSGAGDWGTTWVEGDKLYVSKTVAGQLTNVEPSAPHHSDVVATVEIVGALGIGSILVGIQKHKTLSELTDVNGTALSATGQIPVWNNTAGYFDFDYNITNYLKRDQTIPDTTVGLFTFPQLQVSDLSATRFAYSQASGRLSTSSSANDITIPVQAGKTAVLENPVWDDLQIIVSTSRLPASNAPSWTAYKGSEVLTFSKSATNTIYFSAQLPHTYKTGTDIEFHIHIVYPDANAGDSVWYFTWSWASMYGSFPAESNSGNVICSSPTTADTHKLCELVATIDGHTTPQGISSILLCSLSRIGGNGSDTYDNVIYLIGADFHHQIDTIGSRTATSK